MSAHYPDWRLMKGRVSLVNGTTAASSASGYQAYPTAGRAGSAYLHLAFVDGVQHTCRGPPRNAQRRLPARARGAPAEPAQRAQLAAPHQQGGCGRHRGDDWQPRKLLKDQLDPTENGLYTITAGNPVRTTDMDTGFATHGPVTVVARGKPDAVRAFVVISDPSSDVVGQDPLQFSMLGQSPAQLAGTSNSGLRAIESDAGTSLAVAADTGTMVLTNNKEVPIRGGCKPPYWVTQ